MKDFKNQKELLQHLCSGGWIRVSGHYQCFHLNQHGNIVDNHGLTSEVNLQNYGVWEKHVEPLAAEFECVWERWGDPGPIYPRWEYPADHLKPFIGKKTRVKIEDIIEG